MGIVKATTVAVLGSGVTLLHIFGFLVSTVGSFVPCDQLRRSQSIRNPTLYDVSAVGRGVMGTTLGEVKIAPHDASYPIHGKEATRPHWRTIPPPQSTSSVESTDLSLIVEPPPPSSPPPIDLAKQYVALSQKQVQSILIGGRTNNDASCSSGPSIQSMYEATKTIKAVMKQKEQLFRDIVTKQQIEQQRAQQQFMAWQAYYNQTIQHLQAKTHQQEQSMENQTRWYESQVEEWRNRATQQERTASEKIQWLTEQLQTLKLEAHAKQVQASQVAHAEQQQLQRRVDELLSQLQQQMQLVETVTGKHKEQCTRRAQLESEMAQIRIDYQKSIQSLEKQVSSEKESRETERNQARQDLESKKSKWLEELSLARTEAEQHKAALTEGIKAKDLELQRVVHDMRTQRQSQQAELSRQVDSLRAELARVRADHKQQLELEQQATLQKQSSFLTQMQQLKSELESLETSISSERHRAAEIESQRQKLEDQVARLQQEYDTAVASWQSRYEALQRNFAVERADLQTKLETEREEMRLKVETAERQTQQHKDELASAVQAKQEEFKVAIEELRSISLKTEQDLTTSLQDLSIALQRHKSEAHEILEKVREDALATQQGLLSVIAEKDAEIAVQSAKIKQESTRVSEQWDLRMALEKEVATLKKLHQSCNQEWQQRFQSLEETRIKEQQLASRTLANTEADIRRQVKQVQSAFNDLEHKLQNAQMAKNQSEELLIRTLKILAQRKEKELLLKLESIGTELQDLKMESNRKLASEKEAAKKVQDNLVSQIAEKERELDQAKRTIEDLSERVNESMRKQMEIENHLQLVNKQFDSALTTWERTAKSHEEARRKEKEAAVAMVAQKEAEMLLKVAMALDEAAVHKVALESGLKARDQQISFELQQNRQAAEERELELGQRVEALSQQLQDIKMESHQTLLREKHESDEKLTELRNLLTQKDLELNQQRELTAQHSEESQQLKGRQKELYREISELRLQSARAVASVEARNQQLVIAREHDQKESAQRLSQLEEEARAKVEAAVATAQKYETLLTSSLQNMSGLEAHFKSEITKLQRMVNEFCSCAEHDRADFLKS